MLDAIGRDLRFAARGLWRSPGFTAITVATLALGIGANTAIFSVVNAVLLRPLAYRDPARLVALRGVVEVRGLDDVRNSAPEYQDFQHEVPALADLAAAWPISINLTDLGDPERIQASVVSSNYFQLLGTAPVLGRDFTPEDDQGRIGYVAIISWDLFQHRFGGDRSVIGKTVRLDDDPMTIIGVMPQGFRHPLESGASPMEVWAPVELGNADPQFIGDRRARVFEVIGRLKPGATLAEAQAQLDALSARLESRYPEVYPAALGWRAAALPLSERVVGNVRPALLVLLGAVAFVLLIGCANVANLMLARATGRSREIAIRTALGGDRLRLVRQLLTESLLLAALGGALGLLLAVWGTSALGRLAALYLPRAREIAIDGPVLAFTAMLILVTGIAFGLFPALQASRPDLQDVLKDSAKGSAGGGRTRMRAVLVVAEVAVALVLLAGAGLLLRSFQRLVAVDPGFDPQRLLTMQVWLPVPNDNAKGRYFTQQQRVGFYDRAVAAVRQVAGVTGAALVSRLPYSGRNDARFKIEGRPVSDAQLLPAAEVRLVSPDYFRTMAIPVLQGEAMPDGVDSLSSTYAMVNRTLAEREWKGQSPVGQRIQLAAFGGTPWVTIVGVVNDVRQGAPDQPPLPEFYLSYRLVAGQEMSLVVRTAGDPDALASRVVGAIRSVDATQPVFGVKSMERLLANAEAERRFSLLLLSLFAAIALLLSSLGIYGVMAYSTSQRRHEIGIRMALGAASPDVLRLVLRQGMGLVLLGLAIGLFGAWALSRVLAGQLYGISARDPLTYAAVATLLGAVALAATWLPARRATRVDPMISLRSE
jgi:putative ABC transport system permease protein